LWPNAFAGEVKLPQPPALQDIPSLELNQPITRDLKGRESHAYKLRLAAGMFARVVVRQQGVDVFLRALDGQRSRLNGVNDPFGRVGPEAIDFVAETTGDYFVEVTARPLEMGGSYEVEYVESRVATNRDRTRVVAANYITKGNLLRGTSTAESNRAALAQYDRARTLYNQLNDPAGQAMSLQHTGRAYEALSDYKEALEHYSDALVLGGRSKTVAAKPSRSMVSAGCNSTWATSSRRF